MNLQQTASWKNALGKIGAVIAIVFILAALDAILVHFRQPESQLHVIAGESVDINGTIQGGGETIDTLKQFTSSELLRVTFETVHSGFWLGGRMWRGVLNVDADIAPGKYRLVVVSNHPQRGQVPAGLFIVTVFPDAQSRQTAATSLILRYTGLSPWLVLSLTILLLLLILLAVYCISHRREKLLLQEGKAEIFRMAMENGQCEVYFGLGNDQGVKVGDELALLDIQGTPVGSVTVQASLAKNSMGTVRPDCGSIRTGFIVSLQ